MPGTAAQPRTLAQLGLTSLIGDVPVPALSTASPAVPDRPPVAAFWWGGHCERPAPERPFVRFDDFRRDPAGHPLRTPSGRIELFSETVASFGYEDCPGHPVWLEPAEWLGAGAARRPREGGRASAPPLAVAGQLDGARLGALAGEFGHQ